MRRGAALALVGAFAATGAQGGALELTEANFEEKVLKSGKFTFVKFLAPWWGHCKSMKPDWDKLGDLYNKADGTALIADVDCTSDDGKGLCEKYGVQGYPTIKYFSKETDDQGEKYEGERDYNALKKFVRNKSKPPCVLETLENCGKKDKAFIEELKEWDAAKVKEEQATYTKQLEEAKQTHKAESDLFEEQKEVAMATMKRQEEAKEALAKATKNLKYKLNILEQKLGKAEL